MVFSGKVEGGLGRLSPNRNKLPYKVGSWKCLTIWDTE